MYSGEMTAFSNSYLRSRFLDIFSPEMFQVHEPFHALLSRFEKMQSSIQGAHGLDSKQVVTYFTLELRCVVETHSL